MELLTIYVTREYETTEIALISNKKKRAITLILDNFAQNKIKEG
jgi:hypothetical protein